MFQLLLQLLIKSIISNTYYIFIQQLLWLLDFGFNDFIGLKNKPVAVEPHGWTPEKGPRATISIKMKIKVYVG